MIAWYLRTENVTSPFRHDTFRYVTTTVSFPIFQQLSSWENNFRFVYYFHNRVFLYLFEGKTSLSVLATFGRGLKLWIGDVTLRNGKRNANVK